MNTLSEISRQLTLDQTAYLGPATITAIEGLQVRLECPDYLPLATIAIAQSYRPTVGDIVLAIGRENNWYVIGLLKGSGKTTFVAPGDMQFIAPEGRIDLVASEGINLKSESVDIVANKLEMTARRVFQRFEDVTQWILDTLHVRARRSHTAVEEDYHLSAKRVDQRAEGDFRIDGDKIHLA